MYTWNIILQLYSYLPKKYKHDHNKRYTRIFIEVLLKEAKYQKFDLHYFIYIKFYNR